MTAYYNENDAYAAQWLRNLIAEGHIAPGDVDERSIADVKPVDLIGYTQCHFFAGIGGWPIALRLAGWPDERPVWTGSCPCQPFSAAGKQKGFADDRHLWPVWSPLIAERRPPVVFGEQVAQAIKWGWLDAVFADLETEGYACGASVLPACSVGAPHIRNRAWFVADADGGNASAEGLQRGREHGQRAPDRLPGGVANTQDANGRRPAHSGNGRRGTSQAGGSRPGDVLAHAERNAGRPDEPQRETQRRAANGWAGAILIGCTDGKTRPIEPGLSPLAHGVLNRASKLRAYGNAIVPQVAAEFIGAFLDVERLRLIEAEAGVFA